MRKVYLIADFDHEVYKIGITKNVARRLKQLQTGNGAELRIIDACPTIYAGAIERILHRRFSHLKTSGEWFRLDEEHVRTFKELVEESEQLCVCMQDNPYNTFHPDKF